MQSALRKAGAASVSVLTISLALPAHADDIFDKRWGPWFETGAQIGKDRSLGEADLFLPLLQNSDTLLFSDLRGMFDNRSAIEGNFGIGVRHMLPSGWNIGAYGYYDIRRSSYGNTFQQLTLGAEALSETFDLRANTYLPIGDSEARMELGSGSTTGPWSSRAILTGTSLAIQHQAVKTTSTRYRVEKALAGVDAEMGVRLPVFEPDSGFDMRAFFGGYYFDGAGVEKVAGARVRLEVTAHDIAGLPGVKLTGGLTYQHDKARGGQWIAQARLRIPLQTPATLQQEPLSTMERRMTDAIVRDVDIVSNTSNVSNATYTTLTSTEDAINTWNDERVTSFTRIDGATQDAAALQAALNGDDAGSVVLLNGDLAVLGGIVIGENRTLLGGGATLKLKGADSSTEVDFAAGGDAGRIIGSDDALVEMAAGSALRGIAVDNASTNANAFAVVGGNGASLHDVAISSAANGVKAENTTNFSLHGGTITANKGSAVALSGSTNVDISGARIVQNGASSLGIVADGTDGQISGNTIITNGNGDGATDIDPSARPSHAVSINNGGGLILVGNTITTNGTQANGVHVTNSAGIHILDNAITTNNYMSRGLHLRDSNGAFIVGNTIATNTLNDWAWSYLTIAYGITTDQSSDLTISDNRITTQMRGADGIYLRYGTNNTISGNTVTTHGEAASAIHTVRSTYNTVNSNILTTTHLGGGASGIYFGTFSHGGIAENNTVTTPGAANVLLYYASDVTVRGNRLVGRGDSGVYVYDSDNAVVSGNTP